MAEHERCPGSLRTPVQWVDWLTSELRPVTGGKVNTAVLHQCPRCKTRQYPTAEGLMPTHIFQS